MNQKQLQQIAEVAMLAASDPNATADSYRAALHAVCRLALEGDPTRGLRRQREAAGVTLREMSRRIGVSAPFLCDVERGRRSVSQAVRAAYNDLKG